MNICERALALIQIASSSLILSLKNVYRIQEYFISAHILSNR